MSFDDLKQLSSRSNATDVERIIHKYSTNLELSVKSLQETDVEEKPVLILNELNEVIKEAWTVPIYGYQIGSSLCGTLRNCGGLDLIVFNLESTDNDLRFSSARLLEQCLTSENRTDVLSKSLNKIVNVACEYARVLNSDIHVRVGTGTLEHLFKHNEETCNDVIRLGGLAALLFACRRNDKDTLRQCACALVSIGLFGTDKNLETIISLRVPMWLFPLVFSNDDHIGYYACLAVVVLAANTEIVAEVIKSGTLEFVEPFVTTRNPLEFVKSNVLYIYTNQTWLERLVPLLNAKRQEAKTFAAFHFCMEAVIKKEQGKVNIFTEIGAVEPLKRIARSSYAAASNYAAEALKLIGEEVPYKLSQQVPLWSVEDVEQWIKQIGFTDYASNFIESQVDGDLLLQLTEKELRDDLGLKDGIKRKRFIRELKYLKKIANYSSIDPANINGFLRSLASEFSIYTYNMLIAGIESKEFLKDISEKQLRVECNIINSIHRRRIMNGIEFLVTDSRRLNDEIIEKSLDAFISYRRSNGSQLASLLNVHLQLRGFTVFLDVETLEAGMFDKNILQNLRKAKHFILVLTANALDRCIGDNNGKDWLHKEIVAALKSQCNIIPVTYNFQWPQAEKLPEDMREVCRFNGIQWVHDYQDACVDKIYKFMFGETAEE